MTIGATAKLRDLLVTDPAGPASALAVVAHPDDESFGLGAVLAELAGAGVRTRVVCLTHGEASTLGWEADLGEVRRRELVGAAAQRGVAEVVLDDFADRGLATVPDGVLDDAVERRLGDAAVLVVFEPNGVTGHPDHRAATAAARRVATRRGLPVVEWGLAPEVAAALNAELGTEFAALDGTGVVDVSVDRRRQVAAIACHASQANDNPVLARRLALQGDRERVRFA